MATVSKEIAEQLIERCKKQKRPRYYCIVRYRNRMFQRDNYAYLEDAVQWQTLLDSAAVGVVITLWASDKFRRDNPLITV